MDPEASVDENNDGGIIAQVTTENATEVTVGGDHAGHFEVADGNLKLKDGVSLDFESDTSPIEVTLTAVSEGENATATVSVAINDVNEDPSIDVRDGEEVPGHDGVVSSLTIAENATNADAPPLALIEVMDPDAADGEMLTGDAGVAATSVSDSRFAVILDPEDGLWLHLADGASLNYEEASEVTVTVTFTDSGGNTASQDVTVMVTDENEAPVAVGMVGNVPAEAGKTLSHEVDVMGLFSDPDGSDTIESWTLSNNPDWLELVIMHGQDDDGNPTRTGILQGTPPTTGAGSFAEHEVTITATDSGGETASVSFIVAVDDGNDPPTNINLIDDGQSVIEVEVTEGDASGVVLGEITVDDIDNPQHPYGQHLITVDDDRFEIREEDGRKWLALKEGESLDRERERGEVLVTLRAIDRNGEKDEDGDYEGHRSDPVTFAVVINDVNDAPRGGTIGNWWATIDDRLDAEDIDDGDWVSFELENQDDGDSHPAFTDQDLNAGDSLTYAISGPSWLQIDEESGQITNVEDVKPNRGVYRVTVRATDEDGQSASKTFNLNVAWSDAADDGTLTADNEEPDLNIVTSRPEYRELSGEGRILTFRVDDDDQDIPDHQFALKTVRIKAIVNTDDTDDLNNAYLVDHDGDDSGTGGDTTANDGLNSDGQRATPDRLWTTADGTATGTVTVSTDSNYGPGYAAALELSDPVKSSSGWTFHLQAVDTDPDPDYDTTWLLNRETVPEIKITLDISDGVTTLDDDDAVFKFDIADVDEAPRAPANAPAGSLVLNADLQVNQAATNVKLLYIKLEDLWTDDSDSDNQLDFGASSSGSWVDIWRRPADWSDIAPGRDGDAAETDDNIPWPASDGAQVTIGPAGDQTTYDTVIIGTNDTEPDTGAEPDQMVVIVAIDRTERHSQGDDGSFTLTATDDRGRGETGERTYDVSIVDQNVAIGEGAVTLSGSVREGSTLTANFNDNRDPDLAGSAEPALVLYTWYRVTDDGSDADDLSDDTVSVRAHGTSNTYTPVQGDVGSKIRVVVNYYDVPITSSTNDASVDAESVSLRGQLVGTAFNVGNPATPTGADAPPNVATTSREVSNTPDRGTADITILVNSDSLTVANTDLRIVDGDYPFVPTAGGTVVSDPADVHDNDDPTDTTPDGIPDDAAISFEVSTNGRGGWTAVDEDDVTFDAATGVTTLSLDDGEGEYYRAVVTYDADTGDNAARERVVSDPVRVSDVRDATGAPPLATATINGSPNPGGTLSVDVPNTSFTVQWQIQESGNWVNIPGATGDLRLTQEHAGENIRAVVSYQSRDPDNPGVTAVAAVPVTNAATTGDVIGGTPSDQRPVRDSDYEIEESVGGTGHGFLAISRANNNAVIEHTVPLTSLFQDPDTPSFLLRFGATNLERPGDPDVELVATPTPTGPATGSRAYVYEQTDANGGGVLIFEARSGKLTYLSDKYRGHDGDDTDGDGNVLKLNVTSNDALVGGDGTGGTAEVSLRINVAPTNITFRHDAEAAGDGTPDSTIADDNNDANNAVIPAQVDDSATTGQVQFRTAYGVTTLPEITITENVEHTGREVLAVIDVQDENAVSHDFGSHEVTVSGDDRFVIRKTGGDDDERDPDRDGSTWELHAVRGATFDYETDDMDGDPSNGVQIVLTFSATDDGGLSTPRPNAPETLYLFGFSTDQIPTFASWLHQPIQLIVTIENDARDDRPVPRGPETPGLKDDADDDDKNDQTDGADDDTDGGGGAPPPPGMSLGGLIEDFVGNMDDFEQDILDDFMLIIDDGIDIA